MVKQNKIAVSTNSSLNQNKIAENSTSSTEEVLETTIPSPYPDLKTALFAQIDQQNSNTSTQQQTNSDNTSVKPVSKTNQSNSSTNSYHIISNYKDMNQFNKIKEKVPSAVITTIDKKMKIRLAVVQDKTKARKTSEQLENKGINNYIEEYK